MPVHVQEYRLITAYMWGVMADICIEHRDLIASHAAILAELDSCMTGYTAVTGSLMASGTELRDAATQLRGQQDQHVATMAQLESEKAQARLYRRRLIAVGFGLGAVSLLEAVAIGMLLK